MHVTVEWFNCLGRFLSGLYFLPLLLLLSSFHGKLLAEYFIIKNDTTDCNYFQLINFSRMSATKYISR